MLYCFDIDGCLIKSFIRDDPQKHGSELEAEVYDKVEPLPGRRGVIAALARRSGTRFALVTNQGGVAFGYQTSEQVLRKMGAVFVEFECFHGAPVSLHVCYTHPKATIEPLRATDGRRKPAPGMIREAMKAHGADTETTWFIGDMESDREAAWHAKVRFEWADPFFARMPT